MDMLSTFHFLRPNWLYALLPLAGLLWLLWRKRTSSRSWQSVVDPRLLPHLLIGQSARQRPWVSLAVGLGGLLSILAMAGPAWQKLEVPVFRQPMALVVLLDLSRSMDAADIKPSRLLRAQMKLRDILNQQKEGETALIVYAATPFVVSPLTSDARAIASQLSSLSTDLMPAQGSRPDRAINLALQLLKQSSAAHAGVLLISDGVDGDEPDELKDAIKSLVDAGHRLSILGVGSAEGAPITAANGGFLKDRNGAIILPKLDDASLEALARQGHGNYRRLGNDDSDFQALLAPFKNVLEQQQSKKVEGMNSDQWRDEGPWLLLPLLLLGALAFRRGYVLLLLLFMLPLPRPAYAFDWNSLWQRDDQRAQQALQAKQPQQAAQLFKNPEWRAAANYQAGNFKAAEEDLQGIDSVDAYYNRGNALAKQGQLPEAIKAYEEALKRNPKHDDAKFNRDLVEQIMKQQSQQDKQNEKQKWDKKNQQGKPDDKNGQGQSSESGSDKSGSGKKSEQQDGKEDPHADANKQNAGKSGKEASEAGQSGKDAAAEQQAARKEAEQKKEQPGAEAKKDEGGKDSKPDSAADAQQDSSKMQQADKLWLQRIPDDPGGLWRRKFLYQYKQQKQGKSEDKTW